MRVIEPDPKHLDHQVHKIKLTQPLPVSVADITGDIVINLRSALDNAGYEVAVASGVVNPKNSAFPFAGSVDKMANALGRSKDIPQQIQSLFCGFQPYPGGDDLLWALNEICNTDKHKMLIPVGHAIFPTHQAAHCVGYMSIPEPHVWDSRKNEMELITIGPGTKFDYEFNFRIFVAFGEIKVVEGKEVLRILYRMGCKIQSLLMAIELESRRLGFIKG